MEQLLFASWPRMPKSHRPDLEALRFVARTSEEPGDAWRGHLMWPYINLADLLKPRNLLLLMNSRSRDTPSAFASADFHGMHLGTTTRLLSLGTMDYPGYSVSLNGAQDLKGYRSVHPVDKVFPESSQVAGSTSGQDESSYTRRHEFWVSLLLTNSARHPPHDFIGPNYPIEPEPDFQIKEHICYIYPVLDPLSARP
ncbi:hypothetical protein GGR57DRAFT_510319 [Xylariaceae sp. FL1272]|nr:hypothetical protein GGR57DRAFT_510319 [Xylariaceae sp. FL1272]